MEKILRQISVFLALMSLHSRTSHSALTLYPLDTEVLLNHSTYFNCSTAILSEQIHWYHYRTGEDQLNYVYYKGQFNANYADRYSIEVNIETGQYNLNIRLVQPGDAGRYVCQDDGGLGGQSSAELIVLDSTPTCMSSLKPDGLVGPNSCGLPIEELHLSCSVLYSGNIPPVLQWKMEGEDTPILKGIVTNNAGRSVIMNLTMNSTVKIDGALFDCGTTRSHQNPHSCTTNPVKINYAVGEPIIRNTTKGESVTCSANATVPCQYRWFYSNGALNPEVITTTDLKDYSCEANCTLSGFSCTFIAMRIFVIETATPTASEDTNKNALLIIIVILIAIVVFLLVATFVLLLRNRKAKIANRKCKVEIAESPETIAESSKYRVTRTPNEVNGEGTQRNENISEGTRFEKQPLLVGHEEPRTTDKANEEEIQRNKNTSEVNRIETEHEEPGTGDKANEDGTHMNKNTSEVNRIEPGHRTTDEGNDEGSHNNEDTSKDNAIKMQHLHAEHPVVRETGGGIDEGAQPNENTSAGNGIETQRSPVDDTDLIQPWKKEGTTIMKTSNEMDRVITGVAILEDMIYVVSEGSPEVEAFTLETLELKTRSKIEELEEPFDLASCKLNKCLYFMDRYSASKSKYVMRVQMDSDVKILLRFSTGEEYGNLSVTSDGRVVVTICDSRRLLIYGPDGTRKNVIFLSEDFIHPSHAIELNDGHFLISHGFNEDNVHRVFVINADGELLKSSVERMESPSYLAVDKTGLVFVADQGNSRVCVLNSDLEFIFDVASKKHELHSPQIICLDDKSRQPGLYVVDNNVYKRRKGKLLIFNQKF